MRSRIGFLLFLLPACTGSPRGDGPPPATTSPPAEQPVGPAALDPIVAQFRVDIEPRAGRFVLTPLAARSYDFSLPGLTWSVCAPDGQCLPPAGEVALWTDQQRVSFYDVGGTCYSNNTIVDCDTLPAECQQPGVFCAPLQLVSNAGVLPDVVAQISQSGGANEVLGCFPGGADGLFGLCGAGARVDGPGSNLTSPVQGSTTLGTQGCSSCYGNFSQAKEHDWLGLADAVAPGLDSELAKINTNTFAFPLRNSSNHNVIITVRVARPAFDVPGGQIDLYDGSKQVACATPGQTMVHVFGRGFGPPAECTEQMPPNSCPTLGTPPPGTLVRIAGVPATASKWSDHEVIVPFPADGKRGTVQVVTPLGTVVSTDQVPLCNAPHLIVSGAGHLSGGGITANVEIGHGLRRSRATGGGVTLQMQTAVQP